MFLRLNPLAELNRIRREMNELIENEWTSTATRSFPLVNIHESDDAIIVIAELPGVDASGITLNMHDGVLSVRGSRPSREVKQNGRVLRKERPVGDFEKAIRIPVKVNQEAIAAQFKDGILTVTLPKAEEAKPKPISISIA